MPIVPAEAPACAAGNAFGAGNRKIVSDSVPKTLAQRQRLALAQQIVEAVGSWCCKVAEP